MLPALLFLLAFQSPIKDVKGWQNVKWGMTVSQAVKALGVPCELEPPYGPEIFKEYQPPREFTEQGNCVLTQKPYGRTPRVERIRLSGVQFEGYNARLYFLTKQGSEKISLIDVHVIDVKKRAPVATCRSEFGEPAPGCMSWITGTEVAKINTKLISKYGTPTGGSPLIWTLPSTVVELWIAARSFDVFFKAR